MDIGESTPHSSNPASVLCDFIMASENNIYILIYATNMLYVWEILTGLYWMVKKVVCEAAIENNGYPRVNESVVVVILNVSASRHCWLEINLHLSNLHCEEIIQKRECISIKYSKQF